MTAPQSYRGLYWLGIVYGGSILVAAILSPAVYWLVQAWDGVWPSATSHFLADQPFPRYFDRLRLGVAIALLPWLLKVSGLRSLGELGWRRPTAGAVDYSLHWLAGTSFSVLLVFGQIAFLPIALEARFVWGGTTQAALALLPGAVLVGMIEETLFRGIVLRLFLTAWPVAAATWGSALFFALVHFKVPGGFVSAAGPAVLWWSGGEIARHTLLTVWTNVDPILLVNLTLYGAILNLLFRRTGSLWVCAGFHSGSVFAILVHKKWHNLWAVPDSLWGSESLTDGLAATILLVLIVWRLGWKPGINKIFQPGKPSGPS